MRNTRARVKSITAGAAVWLLLALAGAAAAEAPEPAKQKLIRGYGDLPLSFEVNQGQTDSLVMFLSRGRGYTLFLTSTEAVLALRDGRTTGGVVDGRPQARPEAPQTNVLRMRMVGANPAPAATGVDALPGKSNYFMGNDPRGWRTGVPVYAKVEYRSVYPGVNLVYHGHQRQLEYDFVVSPGADPRVIVLAFEGTDGLAIDAAGDLVLKVGKSEIYVRKPAVYQQDEGKKRAVSAHYVIKEADQVGFEVAAYDTTKPLVIDPVLSYSTYLGGSGVQDVAWAIAVDASGNAYVTGETTSLNFPTTAGAFDTTLNGIFTDAFVTKLNATASALVYSTYLGGSTNGDSGRAIAVDASGNAYVAGETSSSDFPTTAGAFDTSFNGGGFDAFVTKLDATGSSLVYSTYLGGGAFDQGQGIAVDASANAYVAGQTASGNFPTSAGAFDTSLDGSGDAFVTKLNPAGSALGYSTYLGGSDFDLGLGLAVDSLGAAYVTGYTRSTDFPTTAGAFDTSFNGGFLDTDAFVTKLSAAGSALVYSSYLGGSNADSGWEIAVDSSGNAYVAGTTSSTDFPTTAGAFDTTFNGGLWDAFVTKLNSAGSGVAYSTYVGGSGNEQGLGIAVDSSGQAHVIGDTTSPDFPTTAGAIQPAYGGGFVDAFVTKLNATGSAAVYSTYLGGSDQEQGIGIAVGSSGNAYLTGWTSSSNFPTTPGAFDTTFNGGQDAFVAMITDAPVRPPLDHFKFYRLVRRGDDEDERVPPRAIVTLRDQFGETQALVRRTKLLGNPVEKTHDGVVTPVSQPDAHLVAIDIKPTHRTPHRRVEVTNQFGTQVLSVKKPDLLLVPSAKSLVPQQPAAIPGLVDHFLCYRVSQGDDDDDDDDGHEAGARVILVDQFHTENAKVGKAVHLCNPVEKTHDGVVTPIGSESEHLTCYDINDVGRRPTKRRSVMVRHQFSLETLVVAEARTLCVPTEKRVLPPPLPNHN